MRHCRRVATPGQDNESTPPGHPCRLPAHAPVGRIREARNPPAPPQAAGGPAAANGARHRNAARYGPDDVPRFQMMVPTTLLPGARTARESALMGYAAFRRLRPEKRSSAPPLRGNPKAASSRA